MTKIYGEKGSGEGGWNPGALTVGGEHIQAEHNDIGNSVAWVLRVLTQLVRVYTLGSEQEPGRDAQKKMVSDLLAMKGREGICLDLVQAGNSMYKCNRVRTKYISW